MGRWKTPSNIATVILRFSSTAGPAVPAAPAVPADPAHPAALLAVRRENRHHQWASSIFTRYVLLRFSRQTLVVRRSA